MTTETHGASGAAKHILTGMADLAATRDPDAVLRTQALGAGLGIVMHDPAAGVGGLLHVLLPDATIDPERAAARPGLFVDSGLALLLERVCAPGARPEGLLIYIAGGGRILDESAGFNIGRRNREAADAWLAARGLKVAAEDTGGLVNRTMQFNLGTGRVTVRTSGQTGDRILCKR